MNHTVEKLLVPTPDYLVPYFGLGQITQVTIKLVGLTGKVSIVAAANERSAGLTLQNGGRIGPVDPHGLEDVRPIVYYFKGKGTQGYEIIKDGKVLFKGVLEI